MSYPSCETIVFCYDEFLVLTESQLYSHPYTYTTILDFISDNV